MKKIVIGLTGGIACGKSIALKELQRCGAHIIDSDRIAHAVIKKGTHAYKKIIALCGDNCVLPSGKLNRKKIKVYIFNNKYIKKKIERITHPLIIKRIEEELRTYRQGIVVIDAPLLFEAHVEYLVQYSVVIWSATEEQIQRLMKRDHVSRLDARSMIHSQMSLAEKVKRADYVIKNNGTITHLKKQVREWYNNLKEEGGQSL